MLKFCSSTFFWAPSIWFESIFASMGRSSGAEAVQDLVDPVAGEDADQVVLGRQEEARAARVALAAGAAAELVVDAAGLVALGADDVEAAELAHAVAELDVDAAAGHVRRDRDGAALAGVLDDLGLAGVVLGVQHVVRDARAREHPGGISEISTEIVPTSTGWPRSWRSAMSSMTARNFASFVLKMKSFSSTRGSARCVGIDDDVELVDLRELVGLGGGRARHARELLVHAEVVLEGDRGEGLVLLPDPHALLRLERLVEALGLAPALEDAAGELVDDHQLAVPDDVLHVRW